MARNPKRTNPESQRGLSGLVIQTLCTEWTKKSRGGPGARLRNATPHAMVLPVELLVPRDATARIHSVAFREWNHFAPLYSARGHRGRFPLEIEALDIERTESTARVVLRYSRLGMPHAMKPGPGGTLGAAVEELFQLSPGQWGRALYNERFTYFDTGEWGYHQHVMNVGLLDGADFDVFLRSEPQFQVSRLADLH